MCESSDVPSGQVVLKPCEIQNNYLLTLNHVAKDDSDTFIERILFRSIQEIEATRFDQEGKTVPATGQFEIREGGGGGDDEENSPQDAKGALESSLSSLGSPSPSLQSLPSPDQVNFLLSVDVISYLDNHFSGALLPLLCRLPRHPSSPFLPLTSRWIFHGSSILSSINGLPFPALGMASRYYTPTYHPYECLHDCCC